MNNLRKFTTEAEYSAATLNYPSVAWVTDTDVIHFDKESPTPTGFTCYEVISSPITAYTATTYDSVYSFADLKWYMKNNLNAYEEYGVYDVVEDISSATTYEGKLGVVGETEYQYSGGSWTVVGSYVDSSVTYTIDDTSPSPYVGQELSTTFKIPVADVEALGGWLDFQIMTSDGGSLKISTDQYRYMGGGYEVGTVTNDGTYYNYSLPTTESIVINSIMYWDSTPIHIIVGSKQASVEYEVKDMPTAKVYSTVADMEADTCPTVGVGEFGLIGKNIYQFTANETWNQVDLLTPKFVGFYSGGGFILAYDNGDSTLTQNETNIKNLSPAEVYVGNSVTTVGYLAFTDSYYPYQNNISSVTMSNNVTAIGKEAFVSGLSITNITIPSGVTSIGEEAFRSCTGLTSITVLATTPPTLGNYAFNYTPIASGTGTIYVPAASVEAYKTAPYWSTYKNRIQAIPNS